MKKTFTILIAAIAAILMMAQPVKVIGQTRSNVLTYTLTPASGSNNSYAGNCDIIISGITWNLTGNSTTQPWRIGLPKNNNGTTITRALYSKTAISDNITEIKIQHGSTSTLTVNSMAVKVYSTAADAASGSTNNIVASFTPTFAANDWVTITKQDNSSWANCFYRIEYSVTATGNSASYLQFTQAEFYKAGSTTEPSITFNNGSVNVGKTLDLSTLFSSNSTGTVTYSITEGNSYASLSGTDNSILTGVAVGSVTVKASQEAAGSYNAGEASATITVNAALTLISIAITTPPTKITYSEGETFDPAGMVVTATYSNATTDDVTASCTWTPNRPLTTSDTEITISYTENNVAKTTTQAITVNEVVDYATLPFEFDGGKADIENTIGLTQNGIDNSDYSSSPKLKFKTEGCYLILKINETPGELTFDIKGNGMSGSYEFSVMTSTDGITYETNTSYTSISGSTESKTINNLASDVRYIKWVYTTKYNGNVALGNIHLTKGVTVTFDGNGGTYNSASTYTQTVPSGVASNLDENNFTRDGFAFNGWNNESDGTGIISYTDGESITITEDLTLYAQWVQLYTATVADNIENGTVGIEDGSGIPVSLSVPAGTEITLTNTPYSGYIFSEWNVYWMNGENPEPVTVTNNKFNMPAHNVTVSATFTTAPTQVNYAYSINGVLGDIQTADYGTDITLADGSNIDEYHTFVGWTTNPNNVDSNNLYASGDDYTINTNVVFYAVYDRHQQIATSMTINASTENFPDEYGTANNFDECVLNGKTFMIQQVFSTNSTNGMLQFRASGHKNGTGTIYNSDNFGVISSIVLNYNSSDSNKNFTIKAGDAVNPTGGTTINPSYEQNGTEYTFDLSEYSYGYFVLTNGTNAGYLDNIIIYYSGIAVTGRYTQVFPSGSVVEDNITINGPTIIESGTVLDMGNYELTNTNAANLIIEDGGVLVTKSSGVKATVKKNVAAAAAWGEQDPEHPYTPNGWYFIASPVNNASFNTAITSGDNNDYDLYMLDWATSQWLNKKNNEHAELFANGFQRGTGYLYASEAGNTLSVAGEIQPLSNSDNATVTLATTGWNLIGNPLTCKVTVSCGFDELNGAASTTTKTSGSVINPYQGIAVYGNAGDEVTFTKAASQNAAAPSNNNSLQMTLSQTVTTRGVESSKVIDNAVVSFSNNSGMPKFNMLGGNAKLYIPQNGEDYAIAFSNRQGDMPLNFKTTEAGMYTISFEGDNMDLKGVCLIDMLAEEEIDLSVDPSYTFIGSPADKAERFKIVFSPSTGSGADIFAYQSGSDIIVSGEGELQIFDVMGRKVKTQYVSGVQTVNVNAQGVYIMKLNEKTQKIIVR